MMFHSLIFIKLFFILISYLLSNKFLTLFRHWYFDIVFALGGWVKSPPPNTLLVMGECQTLET